MMSFRPVVREVVDVLGCWMDSKTPFPLMAYNWAYILDISFLMLCSSNSGTSTILGLLAAISTLGHLNFHGLELGGKDGDVSG